MGEHVGEDPNAGRPVTVGVDGRPGGVQALSWAAAEARTRGAALRVVHAYQLPIAPAAYPPGDYDVYALDEAAQEVVSGAVAEAAPEVGDLPVVEVTAEGNAVQVLLAESASAALVVVGTRGRGWLARGVLGSCSAGVAARAHCPVVVVRGPGGPPDAPVVVGVDGTDLSDTVLAFAFEHAARHGVGLRAVLCSTTGAGSDAGSEADEPARAVAEALAGWREKYPDVRTDRIVVRGRPVDGLVEESAGARLLVVGARGRHALAGTLLGSVSQGVLREASVPVAVVHPAP
ncbi:Nucleotide-binding universal stress protein, UspA family [Actinopolymorpha cephalotaxi]|uniref:Nucleotide-binding universal stress UspA family protein n=1 Tax=Actinopolymorpha cephalotaxi TaxID=504797 RepID=A0A1I2VIH3_9ACTN|nr:universal stress protein [Actinopolymorpha cephalotaxi]NYH83318.1 nucleotide-binding universal stress UspA family protein [Actinopolymorpha cephalotaxi]SFG88903.1 Nucleotide-binding universal stress protein, UspA family [Actinopolymorpha cephalotaxi]